MAEIKFIDIAPKPGIQRDGTSVDSDQCVDGVWVRFYKDRPKKIGGYTILGLGNDEIIRNLFTIDSENSVQLFIGQPSTITTFNVSPDLSTTASYNITPAGFVANPLNTWSMTSVAYVDVILIDYIIAVAAPNAIDISNQIEGALYYGPKSSLSSLLPVMNGIDPVTTAGGIMNIGKFLIVYGANGFVNWNDGLSINTWPADSIAQFGTSKFIYGAPTRSGTTASGLLWTLHGVVIMTYVGTTAPQFTLSYVSTITTILSQGCVISADPYFFWIGINTFFMYNGVVSEIENNTNKLWFFSNININYKQKVTGYVNKEYNEVWWLAPLFGSTENNWALIYNYITRSWYDTPINRSCGVSANSQLRYPLLASSVPYDINSVDSFPIWAHEFGVDAVDPVRTTAILSSFQTNKIWTNSNIIEFDTFIPDVQLSGPMFFNISSQGYPNTPPFMSTTFSFDNTTEFLTVRVKGSILSTTFTSNTVGGDYLFGKSMYKIRVCDDQRAGPSIT